MIHSAHVSNSRLAAQSLPTTSFLWPCKALDEVLLCFHPNISNPIYAARRDCIYTVLSFEGNRSDEVALGENELETPDTSGHDFY